MPEACIFSNIIMTYLEKLVGTKFLNRRQCITGLSPRVIPHCLPNQSWQTLEMGENPTQQPKMYSFTPPETMPLRNLLFLLSKVSFLTHACFRLFPLPFFISNLMRLQLTPLHLACQLIKYNGYSKLVG